MDTIILSLVAAVCTFLIFIYWLSKWRCCFCWILHFCKLLYVLLSIEFSTSSMLNHILQLVYFFIPLFIHVPEKQCSAK